MKPFVLVGSCLILTATAWAAAPGMYPRGPKNLMSLTDRPASTAVAPRGLTQADARRLARTAEKASEHIKLANFYRGEAEKLDAKATAYEKAAAEVRERPVAKNFAAPGASERWEFAANGFRKESAANRSTATAHERMSRGGSGGF